MSLTLALTVISLILAAIGSSVPIVQGLVYFFYDPGLEVGIANIHSDSDSRPDVNWETISPYNESAVPFLVDNRGEKTITTETWVSVDDDWVPNEEIVKSRFWVDVAVGSYAKTDTLTLGPGGGTEVHFPFIPDTKEAVCEYKVIPRIEAHELGLPDFLGTLRLRPITREYTIRVDQEFIDQILSDRFPEYEP